MHGTGLERPAAAPEEPGDAASGGARSQHAAGVSRGSTERAASTPAGTCPEASLERAAWQSWLLLVLTFVLTTTGLAVAVFSLLRMHQEAVWPWTHTEEVLLIGVCLVVLGFCIYMTGEQRRTVRLHAQVRALESRDKLQLRGHYDRLIAFLNVSRIMRSEISLGKIFDEITKTCLENFDCQQASLMLLNQASGELEVVSAAGHTNLERVLGVRAKRGEGIAGWVAEKNRPLLLGNNVDQRKYPELHLSQPLLSAAIVVPICVRDRVVGVLNVASRTADVTYGEEDLRALQVFAENAGTCIRHVEQADWMRQRIQRLEERIHELEKSTGLTGVH
jgi:hypothetical protein